MTWGSHCSNCGREDCGWAHGEWCRGAIEKMANALEAAEREIDECHEVERIDRDEIAGLRDEAAAARTLRTERDTLAARATKAEADLAVVAEALFKLERWSSCFVEKTPISAETLWREFPAAIKNARAALARLDQTNRGDSNHMQVEVVERRDTPGAWSVEAIDHGSEGEVYLAVFSGPDAQGRAHEYARTKYRLDQTPEREGEDG